MTKREQNRLVVSMVTVLCNLGSPNRTHAKALLRSLQTNNPEGFQKIVALAREHQELCASIGRK